MPGRATELTPAWWPSPARTWDAQWQQSLDLHAGLAIVPNVNLVTNVGFGPDASHTRTRERYSFLPAREIEFPLVHPRQMVVDRNADVFTYYSHFRNVPRLELIWLYKLWDGLYSMLKRAKRSLLGQAHPMTIRREPVSFIVPAYNCARTIRQTIGSIFEGNFEAGDEIIVVDDCSTDSTPTTNCRDAENRGIDPRRAAQAESGYRRRESKYGDRVRGPRICCFAWIPTTSWRLGA